MNVLIGLKTWIAVQNAAGLDHWKELYLWIKRVLQKAVDKHIDRAASSCCSACECTAVSICDKDISIESPGGSYSD